MTSSKSIAVLPFRNLSAEPDNEYFSDGLTEEIINALTKVAGLKVTARTSSFAFKDAPIDVKEIGQKLNVSLLLEGSIRKSANKIRITTQLNRTFDGFSIWSETFDRQLIEIFELQDEISLLIADKIRENYGHLEVEEQLSAINTSNIEAYQYYLRGKQFYNAWDMPGFLNAANEYQKSIEADPTFDLPYFGAGLSYSFLGSWGSMKKDEAFDRVNHFFGLGNALNIESSDRYYSVAKHLFWGLWDFKKAYNELYKAYQLLPQDASINEFMSEINALAGNFLLAKKHIDASIQINPLSPTHYYTKAQVLYLQNQFLEAIDTLQEGISIDPTFSISQELLMACLIQLGEEDRFTEAVNSIDTDARDFYKGIYDLVNNKDPFNDDWLNTIYKSEKVPLLAWDLYIAVHQNQKEDALNLLEHRLQNRMGQVLYLKYDPFLKPLHGHPLFRALVMTYSPENNIVTHKSSKTKGTQLTEEEASHFSEKLRILMENEKPYLNPKLGLKDLAERLELHPNKLSFLLNETFSKNFYHFVNEYRIKDFQQKALDTDHKHLSIMGLALESGFNSKSVFNDFFKKVVGLTPKNWLKKQ